MVTKKASRRTLPKTKNHFNNPYAEVQARMKAEPLYIKAAFVVPFWVLAFMMGWSW